MENKKQFYFSVKSPNGRIILASEGYSSASGCLRGIRSVKQNSASATAFRIRRSKDNKPYFVLVAANHCVIGTSETYSSAWACRRGIRAVQSKEKHFEIWFSRHAKRKHTRIVAP